MSSFHRLNQVFEKVGFRIQRLKPRPAWTGENSRVEYQLQYVGFPIAPGDRVLDIGSGGYPFPFATTYMDKYPSGHWSRHEPVARVAKPFVTGDVEKLPFADKTFNFVYASHVLQSIDDPLSACLEIMRVGRAGFIEVPTVTNAMLFSRAKGRMKWHAVAIDRHLCFFECTTRQLEGVRCTIWRDQVMSRWHEPVQDLFYPNRDILNVLFPWNESFSVFVFRQDGSVQTAGALPDRDDTEHVERSSSAA